jgi:hypothetical protein
MSDHAVIERRPLFEQSRDGQTRYTEPGAATCGQCGKMFRFKTTRVIVCPHCGMIYEAFELGSRVLQEAGDET